MRRTIARLAALPLAAALGACVATTSAPPPQTTLVMPPTQTAAAPLAPTPPPPPETELVPPPPPSGVATNWQPGHWRYTGTPGNPWSWQRGQYVAVPSLHDLDTRAVDTNQRRCLCLAGGPLGLGNHAPLRSHHVPACIG